MRLSELSKYCRTDGILPDSIPANQLNIPCCGGQTLLGAAADQGNDTRIMELVVRGADPNGIDLHGQPPIIVATLKGKTSAVRQLLKHGANPDARDSNGRTALMYALYIGHVSIAKDLERSGARPSVRDFDGRTAMDYAGHLADQKNMKAIAEFVEDLDIKTKIVKTKLAPMRSDPEFVALEHVRNLKFSILLRLAIFTWVGLTILELLAGLEVFGIFNAIHYGLPSWFGHLISYLSPGLIFGWGGFAFVALSGWLVPFVLVYWPIVQKRRMAQSTKIIEGDIVNLDEIFASISTPGTSARGIANIMKQGGRKAFESMKRERSGQGVKRRLFWIAYLQCLLAPNLLGLFQILILYAIYFISGSYPEWYLLLPTNIALLFLIYLFWRALASRVFSQALIAKQIYRSEQMSERLEELSEVGGASSGYILYLRAFEQDGNVSIGNFDFEAVLTFSLSEITDVVALGREKGRLGPVSLETEDATWEDRVLELAKSARLIITVPAATNGVEREVQIMKENGLLSKCLFVAPPEDESTTSNEQAERWSAMLSFGVFAQLDIPAYLGLGFLFRLDNNGELVSWDALGLQLEPPPINAESNSMTGPTRALSPNQIASHMAVSGHRGSLAHASAVHHNHMHHTSHHSHTSSTNLSNGGRRM